MLIPYELPPGVYRNGTRYSSQGRFYDADLWRWFEGTQQPVGGWRKKSPTAVDGKGRAVLTWVDNNNSTWTAVGSNEGLFVYSRAGTRYGITPVGWVNGPADATTGGGYGLGKYGAGFYGTPRPDDTNIIPAMVWTLDTFGEVLIACDGEEIYEWELDTAQPATLLSAGSVDPLDAAPSAVAIFVTEEGAIVALGANGDPRKAEWCDPDNRHDWNPNANDLAGGVRIQTQGKLQSGKRIRGGSTLHTDVDCHTMIYTPGSPDVYEIQRAGSGCGIISKQAAAVIDSREIWMGGNRFWMFDGAVNPMDCDVGDYVFNNINRGQVSKVSAFHNSTFREAWFFYPSAGSLENDSYVYVNYGETPYHWNIGKITRLCGTDKGTGGQYPLAVDADGFLYEHEVGQSRDGRQPFADSGPIEIGGGETTMSVYEVIPDESNLGDVEVMFANRDWTMSPESIVGPVSLTAKTDVRFNTRQVAIRLRADPDIDFRVGIFRFNVKQGSRR